MDQRSDVIRQDIESTRAALDDKLDTLETKAREAFDLKHQVAERPWMALGAAVAAGYVLGSMGGEPEPRWHGQPMVTGDYTQHIGHGTSAERSEASRDDRLLAQFDDEIDMIKAAAVSALTAFLSNTIREFVPAMSQHLDQAARDRGKTPSTSPGASMREGTRAGTTNYEGISETTSYGSNRVAQGATPHMEGQAQPAERQRTVGETSTRY
jgi:hypothetical protein